MKYGGTFDRKILWYLFEDIIGISLLIKVTTLYLQIIGKGLIGQENWLKELLGKKNLFQHR